MERELQTMFSKTTSTKICTPKYANFCFEKFLMKNMTKKENLFDIAGAVVRKLLQNGSQHCKKKVFILHRNQKIRLNCNLITGAIYGEKYLHVVDKWNILEDILG